jgi:hypothetical protein
MPLHIPIYVNNQEVCTVHIGRDAPLVDGDPYYPYIVTMHEYPQTLYPGRPRRYTPNWGLGVEFVHKRSDGVLKCLSRALEALEGIEKATST